MTEIKVSTRFKDWNEYWVEKGNLALLIDEFVEGMEDLEKRLDPDDVLVEVLGGDMDELKHASLAVGG